MKKLCNVLSSFVVIAILMSAMPAIIPGVNAVLCPHDYMGTEISKDTENNTITNFTIHITAITKVHNLNTGEDFVTIQAAIYDPKTLNAHVINVDPGTYTANVIVNKSLTINSTSGNPADTIVLAANPDADVFKVAADYVTISGFTMQGADEWLRAGIHRNSTNNCIIANNNVSSNFYGFLLQNSSNNSIYHNDLTNNTNQAYDDTGTNAWNSSYPSGGNYWGDYIEEYKAEYNGDPEDKLCGADQDKICDGDGIWDKSKIAQHAVIGDIVSDTEFYEGQKVIIDGEYRGWNCSGVSGPGITRSDWCFRDGTGIIYVTGLSPGLDYPDDMGERVIVTGVVRVTESDIVYIEATSVEI